MPSSPLPVVRLLRLASLEYPSSDGGFGAPTRATWPENAARCGFRFWIFSFALAAPRKMQNYVSVPE
jgi:hypothetical protein